MSIVRAIADVNDSLVAADRPSSDGAVYVSSLARLNLQ
jgi:hypothetical protein